ncbi:YciI family protein [Sphingomonas sp. BN140010]|uniref:YciI family protein n=1 Tax=Sphingomonas arvum TaxID=2992113 RepID=A0ABT3JEW3_9SPHN|nr:YciI family protein [Sphingomonas sp. BN140010]MCW3797607.1 YciI family protein [Sphingomonas sp. BN140010]
MLFAIMGFYKPEAELHLADLQDEVNEFVGQPLKQIRVAGPLFDEHDRRMGNLMLVDAADFDEAKRLLGISPFYQHDLYERTIVTEFRIEVGKLTGP